MIFKGCLPAYQILFLTVFAITASPVFADQVIMRDGRVQEGTVVGARGGNVIVSVGAGEMGIPAAQVDRIEMAVPEAYTQGMAAYEKEDLGAALGALRPLVETYKGLPTNWAQRATGTLGDLYIRLNDLENAEKAYAEFQKLYPGEGAGISAEVGLARLDAARGNFAQAVERLNPVAEQALAASNVTSLEGAAYGQAFFVLGQAAEEAKQLPEALEHYLRTVTVFYHDTATANLALARANELRAASDVTVP